MNGVAFVVSDAEVGHVLFDRIRNDSVEGFLQAFLASSDVLSARKAMVILAALYYFRSAGENIYLCVRCWLRSGFDETRA